MIPIRNFTGPEQGVSFMRIPTDAAVEDKDAFQKSFNSSTEGGRVGEEIVGPSSQVIQAPSSPTSKKETSNAVQLTVVQKQSTDSKQLKGSTDGNFMEASKSVGDVKRSSSSLKSSPSAVTSQGEIRMKAEQKSSKTSINNRKSSRNLKPSDSNARISKSGSNAKVRDLANGSSHSLKAKHSTTKLSSGHSTSDTSVGLEGRKSTQSPLSSTTTTRKSKAAEKTPHSSVTGPSFDQSVKLSNKSRSPQEGPSRKTSNYEVSVKNSRRSLPLPRAASAGRSTPKDSKSQSKNGNGSKIDSRENMRSSSSATLSRRSMSRNSSRSGIESPVPHDPDKELTCQLLAANDKDRPVSEQKNVVRKTSSKNEQAAETKPDAEERSNERRSKSKLSTRDLSAADLEQDPKSGQSSSGRSNASTERSDERCSNARSSSPMQIEIRNSSSKSSLKSRGSMSPSERTDEGSASAGSSRQFEVLDSSKSLNFASPSYPERRSRSKTSLNKMEVLNTDPSGKLRKSSSAKKSTNTVAITNLL